MMAVTSDAATQQQDQTHHQENPNEGAAHLKKDDAVEPEDPQQQEHKSNQTCHISHDAPATVLHHGQCSTISGQEERLTSRWRFP
jgi:hypothetical protein